MKPLAIATTILSVLVALAMIAAFFIAIWHPWGHSDQWTNTGFLLMFLGIPIGGAAAFLWVEATS